MLKDRPLLTHKKILVTGGAGFIGGTFIRKLLLDSDAIIYNIDKLNYASDLSSIRKLSNSETRHQHFKIDLVNFKEIKEILLSLEPDLIVNFAAESHVDRSLDSPRSFIENNIIGTFNLLEATRLYLKDLSNSKKRNFVFHHISTDEVFGSLDKEGSFNEQTNYDPRSPYSATKASSDHLVFAWHYSYDIPIKLTNCSNNYGPYQFPEKLIPLTIYKCLNNQFIPLYGNGLQVRDWLHVDDHIDALLKVIENGVIGKKYCIGGFGEKTNLEVVKTICSKFDELFPNKNSYLELIKKVKDRPGHDKRYSINSKLIQDELGWYPKLDFNDGISKTILWYLENQKWTNDILMKSGYSGERIGYK